MITKNSLHDSNNTGGAIRASVAMETVNRGGERHRESFTTECGVLGENTHVVLHPKYDSHKYQSCVICTGEWGQMACKVGAVLW